MPTARHTYLQTHKLAGRVLSFNIATEEAKLKERTASGKQGRSANTLVKQGQLRVSLLSLQKGSELSSHKVEGDVSIQVLRGALEIRTSGESIRVPKGGLAVLRAGVQHDARALRDTTALLTTSMR
jgi:quercetin dioxygenase-like cupin family protein